MEQQTELQEAAVAVHQPRPDQLAASVARVAVAALDYQLHSERSGLQYWTYSQESWGTSVWDGGADAPGDPLPAELRPVPGSAAETVLRVAVGLVPERGASRLVRVRVEEVRESSPGESERRSSASSAPGAGAVPGAAAGADSLARAVAGLLETVGERRAKLQRSDDDLPAERENSVSRVALRSEMAALERVQAVLERALAEHGAAEQ